jgi:hypothetical protein
MRYGMILPGGRAREQLELAVLAERAGWDGVFVWEAAYGVDAWSLLAAVAARTTRILLGTLLTPLPWRRPWKVASQVATVDQISHGRAILTVGLGALDINPAGEVADLRERAQRLDEGIDLIRALWAGETTYQGHHYRYDAGPDSKLGEVARPVQERIPIWVVGAWPRRRSMERVLRCDGIVPQYQLSDRDPGPQDARALCAWLAERGRSEIDVVGEGETSAGDPAAASKVARWAEAGCTWWLETRWETSPGADTRFAEVRERLAAGPPRLPAPTS